jgi:DNA replication protein DnaC
VYPIIFTSNLSPEKMVEKFGDRIVSRIIGSCDVVELTGNDRRI